MDILNGIDILVLTEIWVRGQDDDLCATLDEYLYTNGSGGLIKGFGGAEMIINPIFKYGTLRSIATRSIQVLVIRVMGITITGLYISAGAKEQEKLEGVGKI